MLFFLSRGKLWAVERGDEISHAFRYTLMADNVRACVRLDATWLYYMTKTNLSNGKEALTLEEHCS